MSASPSKSTGEIHWQSEVTRRLGDYRARKQRLQPEAAQPVLPFRQPKESPEPVRERPRPRANPNPSHRRMERLEICVQPELDFSSSADDRAHPQTALVPVASLSQRRGAAALDALFIGLTSAGFLALFHALGGQIGFEKMDILVYAVVLYLFYGQYFFSVHHAGWCDPWNAIVRAFLRSPRWQPPRYQAAALARLRLSAFGSDSTDRVSLGHLG
jgi:hypothetical protein